MSSRYLLVALTLLFVTPNLFSQRNYQGAYNRIGLQGGLTIADISTDNFKTNAANGFTAGFTTRGAFYNNFDLVYGVNFYNQKIDIQARETIASEVENVDFGIFGVQLNLFASYNIIGQYLTIEAGPALQISSNFNIDEEFEDYIVDGYNTLQTQDLEDITNVNVNGVIGVTGGFEDFRIWAQYQYGINNILNSLNAEGLEQTDPNVDEFEGNLSLINVGIVFYL